jgi:hypothetical protein
MDAGLDLRDFLFVIADPSSRPIGFNFIQGVTNKAKEY